MQHILKLEMRIDLDSSNIFDELNKVAERIVDNGHDGGKIHDYNGNTIGSWDIVQDDDWTP